MARIKPNDSTALLTAEALLEYAKAHESDQWYTLARRSPFHYTVTANGIEFTPDSSGSKGSHRFVPVNALASYLEEFHANGNSLEPGKYPSRFNKSYVLPLIKRFLESRA